MAIDTGQATAIYGLLLDVRESIGRIDERSDQTLRQTTQTNGKVEELEDRIGKLERQRFYFAGAWVIVMATGAIVWEFVQFYFDHFVARK